MYSRSEEKHRRHPSVFIRVSSLLVSMTTFEKLENLVAELETGDKVLWIGSHSIDNASDTAYPNTVTNIEYNEDRIRVDGEGINDGRYHFVIEDGESKAYHHDPNEPEPMYKGEVKTARITDSGGPVPVKEIFDDLRDK